MIHLVIFVATMMVVYWLIVLLWSIAGWVFWSALWLILWPFAKAARLWRWAAGRSTAAKRARAVAVVINADFADNIVPFRQKR